MVDKVKNARDSLADLLLDLNTMWPAVFPNFPSVTSLLCFKSKQKGLHGCFASTSLEL